MAICANKLLQLLQLLNKFSIYVPLVTIASPGKKTSALPDTFATQVQLLPHLLMELQAV